MQKLKVILEKPVMAVYMFLFIFVVTDIGEPM